MGGTPFWGMMVEVSCLGVGLGNQRKRGTIQEWTVFTREFCVQSPVLDGSISSCRLFVDMSPNLGMMYSAHRAVC